METSIGQLANPLKDSNRGQFPSNTEDREEHSRHLRTVLEVLQERKLLSKFGKCEFWLERVAFLGHIIFESGVEVDPFKVQAVKEWSAPRNASKICSFLGLAGYYRKFINEFSSIVVPLTELTKKNAKFVWSPKCQESFDVLKEALTSAPVLAMPSGHSDFVVYTNDSKLGLGSVLMQRDRVIAYASSYHPGKANVVADTLSRETAVIASMTVSRPLQDEIKRFGLEFYVEGRAPRLSSLTVQTTLFDCIRVAQAADEQLRKWRQIYEEKDSGLYSVVDGIVKFRGQFWVLAALGTKLLFSTAFHAQTDGQSDRATIGMAPYKALYGRPFRSPVLWTEIGERSELGPKIVQQTAEVVAKIRDRMRTAWSRQKNYVNHRRKDLEFLVGDHVFVRVVPMKGVMRFEKKREIGTKVYRTI
ncbi:uncharacterized protein [Henckelia pumila]|uniref:uncharacterized protein n=1 Tax=Henckelia pumila TaxID=405737 RepID=UPI003C6E8C6E